jgi:hypothetical protein
MPAKYKPAFAGFHIAGSTNKEGALGALFV